MFWTVYDMANESIVGTWIFYEDCLEFCVENQELQDDWQIFPADEVIVTADVE